ncbi:Ldh family oxidoreductase [Burkholderia sp. RS01]|uniref:Ldh family oxidoreductase n=1 Tax=unclassified Burkholderia TaxID=2613784 RepID=UPI0032183A60
MTTTEGALSGYDLESEAQVGSDRKVDATSLRQLVTDLLAASKYPQDRAELVADSLVEADMRGVSSHGVSRTRIYSRRSLAGLVDATAEPLITGKDRAARRVDAMNVPGQVAAQAAVMEAISGARQLGMCAVGVVNSNHCGALAFFLKRIAEAGLVGVAASNGPAVMAYFGGRSRAVGTNPLGYSIPRPGGPPIILDMATSNAARGKIISMARSGVGTIPEGWAVDVNGRMTTDPADALAGAVLPFAGPKGSGLAMGIEFLCGTMLSGITGSQIGDMYEQWDRPQRVGHIFFAIDPASWGTPESFEAHVREFVDEVAQLPPAEGFNRVLLPGELEEAAESEAAVHGVLLSGTVIADLESLASDLGVAAELLFVEASA